MASPVNINSFSPSLINQTGEVLKAPFNYIVLNTVSGLLGIDLNLKILRTAATIFAAYYLFIPSVALFIAGKVICRIAPTRINWYKINERPIDIPAPNAHATDHNALIGIYSREFGDADGISVITDACRAMRRPVDDATGQAKVYIKGIIHHLNTNRVRRDQKRMLLKELVHAFRVCGPTWSEVTKDEYEKLKVPDNALNKLCKLVQKYKEGRIIHFGQVETGLNHWHFLNTFRVKSGDSKGLQRPGLDQHVNMYNCAPAFLYSALFNLLFDHVPSFIRGVQNAINLSGSAREFGPLLSEIKDEVYPHFYEDADCRVLNEKGALALLKKEGYLH